MDDNFQRFKKRFAGFEKAYGKFVLGEADGKGKIQGSPKTIKSRIPGDAYCEHLQASGSGLGVIPLLEDDTVLWAAIDIDDHGLDLKVLAKKIADLNLPLVVCRSKSGGAHAYLFLHDSFAAERVQNLLLSWAQKLEYPNAEIFPKQANRVSSNVGNWINLPYYNAKNTDRYAIKPDGSKLSLQEFLDYADSMAVDTGTVQGFCEKSEGHRPRNVSAQSQPSGLIQAGQRHNELVRMAASLRGRGHNVEEIKNQLIKTATERCDPPLADAKEIEGIAKWIGNKPAGQKHYPLSDQGNCYRFRDWFLGAALYVHVWKKWMYWDGRRYAIDKHGVIKIFAKEANLMMYDEAKMMASSDETPENLIKFALKSQSRQRIEAMLALAESEMAADVNQFDQDRMLFNCLNGTLDLRLGELNPHNPSHMLTKLAEVEYAPHAKCPLFLEFLDTIFEGDQELIDYVQRLIGYCLTGDVGEHCMAIFYGTGRNGKSTLLSVIESLCGEYHKRMEPKALLMQKNEGVRNDIAALKGARVVTASEIGESKRLNESLVKEMTGGDTISARFLYGEFFEFRPQFKLLMAVNDKPDIRGIDEGIWSRIRLIPFNAYIPEDQRDKKLTEKLYKELPGILNWALEGCRQWQKSGLQEPQVVKDAVAAYRRDMNGVERFMEDCCIVSGDSLRVGATELYQHYTAWADINRERSLSQKVFGETLKKLGYKRDKAKRGGKVLTVYYGISLADGFDNSPI